MLPDIFRIKGKNTPVNAIRIRRPNGICGEAEIVGKVKQQRLLPIRRYRDNARRCKKLQRLLIPLIDRYVIGVQVFLQGR